MTRLLLDTQALIWWDANDPRLGGNARAAIQEATEVYVSSASAWEVVIKEALGKLRTTRRPAQAVSEGGVPAHHRDPFDRIILAVAKVEALTVVTSDPKFQPYGVPLIDALD